ncbi:MAG: ATP-binding cassette domain-containing protein [Acidimicrobiales bacterium]|jgi:branched-chain amino acid transport system ATP-binding protein
MGVILELNHVAVRYGAALGIGDVSIRVEDGETVGMLGANGAGKSTTLRAVTGFLRSESGRVVNGEIVLNGTSIRGLSPAATSRLGVALVSERKKEFATLTVRENLALVPLLKRSDLDSEIAELAGMFSFLGKPEKLSQAAGFLSGGERQMLAIARALLLRPKLLLVDELSFGLAPIVIRDVVEVLKAVQQRGVAMVIVEQNASVAAELANRVYVLRDGATVTEFTATELNESKELRAAYLGI